MTTCPLLTAPLISVKLHLAAWNLGLLSAFGHSLNMLIPAPSPVSQPRTDPYCMLSSFQRVRAGSYSFGTPWGPLKEDMPSKKPAPALQFLSGHDSEPPDTSVKLIHELRYWHSISAIIALYLCKCLLSKHQLPIPLPGVALLPADVALPMDGRGITESCCYSQRDLLHLPIDASPWNSSIILVLFCCQKWTDQDVIIAVYHLPFVGIFPSCGLLLGALYLTSW